MVAPARGSTEARGPGAEPGRERGASHLPHPHGGGEEPTRGGEGQSQVILYASFGYVSLYFYFSYYPSCLCPVACIFPKENSSLYFYEDFFIDIIPVPYTAQAAHAFFAFLCPCAVAFGKIREEKPIGPITKKRRIRAFPHFVSPLEAVLELEVAWQGGKPRVLVKCTRKMVR